MICLEYVANGHFVSILKEDSTKLENLLLKLPSMLNDLKELDPIFEQLKSIQSNLNLTEDSLVDLRNGNEIFKILDVLKDKTKEIKTGFVRYAKFFLSLSNKLLFEMIKASFLI